MLKNKQGVSAVIGVILMVAITVAIAATVYYYVAHVAVDNGSTVTYTGILKGITDSEDGWDCNIHLHNQTITVDTLSNEQKVYLSNFLDKEITLIVFENYPGASADFRGAYLT